MGILKGWGGSFKQALISKPSNPVEGGFSTQKKYDFKRKTSVDMKQGKDSLFTKGKVSRKLLKEKVAKDFDKHANPTKRKQAVERMFASIDERKRKIHGQGYKSAYVTEKDWKDAIDYLQKDAMKDAIGRGDLHSVRHDIRKDRALWNRRQSKGTQEEPIKRDNDYWRNKRNLPEQKTGIFSGLFKGNGPSQKENQSDLPEETGSKKV